MGRLSAQQDQKYTFYRFNMNLINPAFAGADGTTDFGINIRSQWAGVQGGFTSNDANTEGLTTYGIQSDPSLMNIDGFSFYAYFASFSVGFYRLFELYNILNKRPV